MLRYLLLSTIIVLGAAIGLAAWINRDLIRITIEGVRAPAPAKPGDPAAWRNTTPLH